MKKYFLIFIIFFLLLSAFFLEEIFLPKTKKESTPILFTIEAGENILSVGKRLEEAGIIKNKLLFEILATLKGKNKKIKAGSYLLSPNLSLIQILNIIAKGEVYLIKVTITEGKSLKEISQLLNEKGIINFDLTNFKIKDFVQKYPFLEEVPKDVSLEGFLFPETYFFELNSNPKKVVEKFLEVFEEKTKEARKVAQESGKNFFEIIIVASLIEKEVINTPNCPDCKNLVAGILWKRLENQIPLQVDATITFITQKKSTKISIEETKIDNPYNTYKYIGLPPGPICNPGLESILAAIYPKPSQYWYYLSTPQGETIFSKTFKEHLAAKEKYLK